MYYYGARYYDPKLVRFISADTIVPGPFNPQALNRYSYCVNNPIKYIDPSGHGFFSWLEDTIQDAIDWVNEIVDDSLSWLGLEDNLNISAGGGAFFDGNGNTTPFSYNPDTGDRYNLNGPGGNGGWDGGGSGSSSSGGGGNDSGVPLYMTFYFRYGDYAYNVRAVRDSINFMMYPSRNVGWLEFDSRGNMIGESALEKPLIDPVDIIAGLGSGYIKWSTRPFWRYVGPKSNPNSSWLTRGPGWNPPYGTNYGKAKDALQMKYMPENVVEIRVPWYKPVRGPRPATKHPEWGTGDGPEYYKGWQWPE